MSTVLYFSGTGNSYSVAKKIAESQGAKLISIPYFKEYRITDDSIGIVIPVYCGEIPPIVKTFLRKVNLDSNYIWAVAVSGGTVGTTLLSVDKLLKEKNRELGFGAHITLPDNSIVTKPDKNNMQKQLLDEDENVEKIIGKISNKEKNTYPVEQFLGKTSSIQWFALRKIMGSSRKKAAKRKCIKCNKCIQVCPNGNISMKNGKIVFGNNCTDCFACMHWCPQACISAGFIKPSKDQQYTHPDVTINDLKLR